MQWSDLVVTRALQDHFDALECAWALGESLGHVTGPHVYDRAAITAGALTILSALDELAARNDEPTEDPRFLMNCLVRWGRGEVVTEELKQRTRAVTTWAYGGPGKFGAIEGSIVEEPVTRALYFACNALHRLRTEMGDRRRLRLAAVHRELTGIARSYAELTNEPPDAALARVRSCYGTHLLTIWQP